MWCFMTRIHSRTNVERSEDFLHCIFFKYTGIWCPYFHFLIIAITFLLLVISIHKFKIIFQRNRLILIHIIGLIYKILAYYRESKKESMKDHLKTQKPKKNSKRLLLNSLINFTKMDVPKIRNDYHFYIDYVFFMNIYMI